MEKVKFISPERAKLLEESISFLSNYLPVDGEIHHVGESKDDVMVYETKLLKELGEINKRRSEILTILTGK